MLISIKYQEIQPFSGSDKPSMLFFLLINVKMPTIVPILTFINKKNSCSAELSMIFLTSGLIVLGQQSFFKSQVEYE